jgi:hypothetical protein
VTMQSFVCVMGAQLVIPQSAEYYNLMVKAQ